MPFRKEGEEQQEEDIAQQPWIFVGKEKITTIRLPDGPQLESEDWIPTRDEIQQKINQVKQEQQNYARRQTLPQQDDNQNNEEDLRVDLYPRLWRKLSDQQNHDCSSFTVGQFNMLAQGLSFGPHDVPPLSSSTTQPSTAATAYYGGFTHMKYPEPTCGNFNKFRRWRLLEILLQQQQNHTTTMDLWACQEVDAFDFFHHFMQLPSEQKGRNMENDTFRGVFCPKIPSSPGQKWGWYTDGCAIFYNPHTFSLLSTKRIQAQVGNQVFLVVHLRHLATRERIIVITTHLKAGRGEANDAVRTHQCKQLQDLIAEEQQEATATLGNDNSFSSSSPPPVLILGDFNTEPHSDCIQSLLSSSSSRDNNKDMTRALFQVHSAYPLEDNMDVDKDKNDIDDEEKAFGSFDMTTWKIRGNNEVSKRIIDYIFWAQAPEASTRLQCTHILDLPQDASPIPNLRYPSDHFYLGATFQFQGGDGGG